MYINEGFELAGQPRGSPAASVTQCKFNIKDSARVFFFPVWEKFNALQKLLPASWFPFEERLSTKTTGVGRF